MANEIIREGQEQEIQVQKQNYTVGIFPEGTLNITENGNYNVTNYANAEVATAGIIPAGTTIITTNGTHDVTQYASASVDVEGEQVIEIDPSLQYDASVGIVTLIKRINNLDLTGFSNYRVLFRNMKNLTSITLTGKGANATCAAYMFAFCSSLTTVPEFDVSNITEVNGMFYNCTSLVNVPVCQFTTYVSKIENIFYGCPNLSNESLNNIMQICINAFRNISGFDKTLKNIGLTSAQANICKTLSNYRAFTSAGWTTGY